jgi:hypothetical protein
MTYSTLPASMFDDPQIQDFVHQIRARYGRAGLAVIAELCRRELREAPPLSLVDPS